ncbi:hypothetical protein SNE40_003112 [Patella caerulea]|uniref:Uncharacterized protein n=1 Tax=Patella caerulea TaxID=87958 RepID=A0AAN8PZX9_PATCE
MEEFDYRFKVILLGDCGVGKSSLIRTLGKKNDSNIGGCCCYSFTPNGSANLEFKKHGQRVSVQVIDTGGQERYRSMTTSYFRGVDGCLIMYNINNINSFENVPNWSETLENHTCKNNLTTILAGTRSKTSGDTQVPEARAHKMSDYLEVPCVQIDLDNVSNIIEVFEQLVDIMMDKYRIKDSSTVELTRTLDDVVPGKKRFECVC